MTAALPSTTERSTSISDPSPPAATRCAAMYSSTPSRVPSPARSMTAEE